MKTLSADITVQTPSLSLAQVSELLGLPASEGSWERGQAGRAGQPRGATQWRFSSGLSGEESLDEHLEKLFREFDLSRLDRIDLPSDCRLWLSIGVFSDVAWGSVALAPRWLDLLTGRRLHLEVSFYGFTDEDVAEGRLGQGHR